MRNLAVIDIGGTTIKFAAWKDGSLQDIHAVETPSSPEEFYVILEREVDAFKMKYGVEGVAISSPGAVNRKTGVIEGASALPYIHNFRIQQKLEEIFGLPVSIENDANCAALAELAEGAGRDCQNLIFIIIGTGVGGAVIMNRKVWHGTHLFGGEFGYMAATPTLTLSQAASPVSMARRYNEATGSSVDGKTVFDLADQGDAAAREQVDQMADALGRAIYNLQHSFDPEKFILGGAVSNNPKLVPLLNDAVEAVRNRADIATLKPVIETCVYRGNANLRGAVADFEQTYSEG